MSSFTRLEIAQKQIEFTRNYTLSLLDGLDDSNWFWMPANQVSHIAWQVGHLAMAQYGLALFRQRGRQAIDTTLMTGTFRKKFSKGTTPNPDPNENPSPQEIRQVFDGVYQQVMIELPQFDDAGLDEPVDPPHSAYDTKYGALLLAAHHEMVHAGQIGLLRRLQGKDPVR